MRDVDEQLTNVGATRRDMLRAAGASVVGASVLSGTGMSVAGQESEEEWTQFGYDAGNTGHAPENTGPVDNVSQKWTFDTNISSSSKIAVADGTVYVGSSDGNLYALDAATGDQQWVFETGDAVESSPAVVDGTVYVGSDDGNVYAVSAETGEQEWRFEIGPLGDVGSSPAVADGTVYVGSRDNSLYAVDAESGEQEWAFETGGWISSSPAVADGTVYIGSGDDNMYAVNASDGAEQWRFETRDFVNSPAVADGTVYVGSKDSFVYALDAGDGTEQWRFETGNYETETYGRVGTSPAVADGSVYFGTRDGYLYAVDADSGEQEWTFETGGTVDSSPAVADGTVYFGSVMDTLHAIDAESGEQELVFETAATDESSPAVANGTVYIGSRDGNLYALSSGDSTGDTSLEDSGDGSSEDDGSDGVLGGVATTFRRSTEESGLLALLAGSGIAGGGYLAYRTRQGSDEQETFQSRPCPACGQTIAQSSSFCEHCGADLTAQTGGQHQNPNHQNPEQQTPEHQTSDPKIQISAYRELRTGDIVETGQTYQIATAYREGTDRPVWLATPTTGNETMDVTQTEVFLDRIKPWAKMDDHDQLLSVYGHGTDPLPWVATEAASYPLLADSAGECSIPQMLELLAQVCEAVHHVRRYGLAYESLGLASVLFVSPQEVRVRGILDQLDPVERSYYDLPSASEDQTAEAAAVYRLGALAYDILTAQPPEGDPTAVTPPSAVNPSLSEAVDTVILQALAADPEDRLETVLHLRDALQQPFE